jgi:hypothetical protein
VGLVVETKLLSARKYRVELVRKAKAVKIEYLFAVEGK